MREQLERAQAVCREKLEAERAAMQERQDQEREALAREQLATRQALRAGYLAEVARVRQQRKEARPTGLAAFLGRVTGVSAIIHRVQRYKDAKRYLAFRESKQALGTAQKCSWRCLPADMSCRRWIWDGRSRPWPPSRRGR